MNPKIEIEVDGHTALVDPDEYGSDPDATVEHVREARAAVSDLRGIHEVPDWDYDSLEVAFGSDGTRGAPA